MSPDSLAAEPAAPSRRLPPRRALPRVHCFWVKAESHPGTLARVLQPFAKRNLVPCKWHGALDPDGMLSIDVQVAGLGESLAEQIARGLRQIPGVVLVLTTERRSA
jgi:hypothetical protein